MFGHGFLPFGLALPCVPVPLPGVGADDDEPWVDPDEPEPVVEDGVLVAGVLAVVALPAAALPVEAADAPAIPAAAPPVTSAPEIIVAPSIFEMFMSVLL